MTALKCKGLPRHFEGHALQRAVLSEAARTTLPRHAAVTICLSIYARAARSLTALRAPMCWRVTVLGVRPGAVAARPELTIAGHLVCRSEASTHAPSLMGA